MAHMESWSLVSLDLDSMERVTRYHWVVLLRLNAIPILLPGCVSSLTTSLLEEQ